MVYPCFRVCVRTISSLCLYVCVHLCICSIADIFEIHTDKTNVGGKMMKKERNITFRVTKEEYEMIKTKAEKANLTVTRFILECCKEGVPVSESK